MHWHRGLCGSIEGAAGQHPEHLFNGCDTGCHFLNSSGFKGDKTIAAQVAAQLGGGAAVDNFAHRIVNFKHLDDSFTAEIARIKAALTAPTAPPAAGAQLLTAKPQQLQVSLLGLR
jgi:sugar (pentulose or hexulose) kinase